MSAAVPAAPVPPASLAPAPMPVVRPAAPAAAGTEVVIPVPMDLSELAPVLESAGIELAQTDPAKLAAAQARIATQSESPRRGRERPSKPAVEEAPLEQVQTRN